MGAADLRLTVKNQTFVLQGARWPLARLLHPVYWAACFSATSTGGRLRESYSTRTTTLPRLSMYPHFPPVIVRSSSPVYAGVETHPVQTTSLPCSTVNSKS